MPLSPVSATTAALAHWLAAWLRSVPPPIPLPGPAVFGVGLLAGAAVVIVARSWSRWRIRTGDDKASTGEASTGEASTGEAGAGEPDSRLAGMAEPTAAARTAAPVPDAAAVLHIGILGTLTINDQPGALVPAQSQLIVALALSGTGGLSNRRLCGLLGADSDHPRPTDSLRQLIVRTRRQLGRAPDGGEWIEHRGHGVYALHKDAMVDWAEFDALTATGLSANDGSALAEALAMVRGRPFTGCYYWWLETAQIEAVVERIVRAATMLAEIELGDGRPAQAARAARTGLAADSSAEQLWRLLMRAEHAAGNLAGVREAWGRCQGAVAEIAADGLPESATAAVYAELLAR